MKAPVVPFGVSLTHTPTQMLHEIGVCVYVHVKISSFSNANNFLCSTVILGQHPDKLSVYVRKRLNCVEKDRSKHFGGVKKKNESPCFGYSLHLYF